MKSVAEDSDELRSLVTRPALSMYLMSEKGNESAGGPPSNWCSWLILAAAAGNWRRAVAATISRSPLAREERGA
jgi:hypothetical protein